MFKIIRLFQYVLHIMGANRCFPCHLLPYIIFNCHYVLLIATLKSNVCLLLFWGLTVLFSHMTMVIWEVSGRVLDSRPRVAGSSLTGVTALCP